MSNKLYELVYHSGGTYKLSLGMYQFYSSELEKFLETAKDDLRENCKSWMYSFDEIDAEKDPIKKAAMKGYNQGIVDSMAEIAIYNTSQEY